MGWLLAVQAIGCLSAGPIAGVLYDIDQSFMPMIIYSSVTLLLSVVFVDLASKSVSVVNVSNPYDFNHRQGSSLAISSRSSEKLLVDKSMSIRMPVESTAEAVTTSRTHFSMIHYLWSIQLRWSCAETKVFPPTTDAVDVTENEKF